MGASVEGIKQRAEDLHVADMYVYWLIKQYQAQADTIINGSLEGEEVFKAAAAEFDKYKELLAAAVDTEEEKAWIAEANKADEEFDAMFYNEVIPEVTRIIENHIGRLDGEADVTAVYVHTDQGADLHDSIAQHAERAVARLSVVAVTGEVGSDGLVVCSGVPATEAVELVRRIEAMQEIPGGPPLIVSIFDAEALELARAGAYRALLTQR